MLNLVKKIKKEYKKFLLEELTKMPKIEVDAVYEEDIIPFLSSIGLLEPMKMGKVRCEFCNNVATLENFISVFPEDDDIKVCCNNPSCYHSLMKKGL